MKTKLFILTICTLLVGFAAYSQDYVFKVLATKGENTYKTASGSDWEPLRTGTKLNAGDMIKTGEGCYLALLHSSGKPLEIKEAKEFSVDDLSAQVGGGDGGVISKYANFVASKMTAEAKEENRKKYASITGATERGLAQIKFYMNTSADIYNPVAIVRWEDQKEAESYQVTLKDMFDEVLMVAETQGSYFEINFSDERLKELDLVIVNVSVKGNEDTDSGDYAIQRLSDDDAKEYLVELNDLKTSLDKESSISNLIMAEFYEQNNLMLDALTSYEYAIQESPDVDYFKDAYKEFLMRNGYSDKID